MSSYRYGRIAMEFPSQKALDAYLEKHPMAKAKNHSVKKPDPEKKPSSEGGGGDRAIANQIKKKTEEVKDVLRKMLDYDEREVEYDTVDLINTKAENNPNKPFGGNYFHDVNYVVNPNQQFQRVTRLINYAKSQTLSAMSPEDAKLLEPLLKEHFDDVNIDKHKGEWDIAKNPQFVHAGDKRPVKKGEFYDSYEFKDFLKKVSEKVDSIPTLLKKLDTKRSEAKEKAETEAKAQAEAKAKKEEASKAKHDTKRKKLWESAKDVSKTSETALKEVVDSLKKPLKLKTQDGEEFDAVLSPYHVYKDGPKHLKNYYNYLADFQKEMEAAGFESEAKEYKRLRRDLTMATFGLTSFAGLAKHEGKWYSDAEDVKENLEDLAKAEKKLSDYAEKMQKKMEEKETKTAGYHGYTYDRRWSN